MRTPGVSGLRAAADAAPFAHMSPSRPPICAIGAAFAPVRQRALPLCQMTRGKRAHRVQTERQPSSRVSPVSKAAAWQTGVWRARARRGHWPQQGLRPQGRHPPPGLQARLVRTIPRRLLPSYAVILYVLNQRRKDVEPSFEPFPAPTATYNQHNEMGVVVPTDNHPHIQVVKSHSHPNAR